MKIGDFGLATVKARWKDSQPVPQPTGKYELAQHLESGTKNRFINHKTSVMFLQFSHILKAQYCGWHLK